MYVKANYLKSFLIVALELDIFFESGGLEVEE
jgi:hypothetical protein